MVVGRCTGCHHCHYNSSKMVRTLDTNQRQKWQTCRVLSIYIPRPAEIDSQQLQQTWCEHIFLTSSYQLQPAPSPKNGLEKQTNTSSTEQHCKSKLRTQMTPTKDSHKQTNPLANWLSAKQWAGERGDLSKSKRRI